MKTSYRTSVIILFVGLLSSFNLKAAYSDTLKVLQNNGELSLVVLQNINKAAVLEELDLKSILEGLDKNKNKVGNEAVVLGGTANNYQISKTGELYYLSRLEVKEASNSFSIRIYENTTKEELTAFKEKAAVAGIKVAFTNISIVNGEIDALSMEVDCQDGFSGNLSVTDIPEEGIGFIRDYSDNSETPFSIGKIFTKKNFGMAKNDEDAEEDFDIAFNKESTVTRESSNKIGHDHELEIMLGLNNYLAAGNQLPSNNNEVYSLDPISSWTYQINSVHEVKFSKHFQTNFSLGVQWYNFALEDPNYQILKGPDAIQFSNSALDRADINPSRSKLNITYLNAGILPLVHFGKSSSSLRIGAGVYGGYRIGSKSKFKYDDDGKDVAKNSFYLNSWHYGVRAQIGWKGIDLFATYDLNPLFTENRGPQLNAFSFGIVL
ncbi:MAG: hypothetical protein ACJAT1_001931 [Marivirga sp.]|jgi:hypothetical protein